MAGKYIELINPGYSTLWTRDLPYTPGAGEAAGLNPFDPKGARPLIEGEWLERAPLDGKKFTRGGSNVVTVPGTKEPGSESTVPSHLYFMEEGRYDSQVTKRAHVVFGPHSFEFRCRLYDPTGLANGDSVSVWDWDGPAGAWGIVRRVLAKASGAGFNVGKVINMGDGFIDVLYMPGCP
jgi:hypothetical protein